MLRTPRTRIGIDLGGTKIAGIALADDDSVIATLRRPTPRHDYGATLAAIRDLVETLTDAAAARHAGRPATTVGVAMPGSLTAGDGRVQNANSTWLNGQPFAADLKHLLGQPVRCSNDANCFALSETYDGAARGCRTVFGIILGTGCGGGLIVDGALINGPRNIGGEWGHNPLPWPRPQEQPGPACWCGRRGCIETWVSGPAIALDHERTTGQTLTSAAIAANAKRGDTDAKATLARHADRLARALAPVVNIFDPDTIVLGGGLSQLDHLYDELPGQVAPHIFADDPVVSIKPPKWGDASGVRGAARLWPRNS